MDRLACDRMFIAVMETGSFTAAAERHGTSSGQASKLVSRLESELAVRLLNRTTRAVSPTEIGKAYFEQIRHLIDEFDNLDQSVRDAAQTPRGRVRLTAPLTFGTVQLASALNDFARRYPEISLDVSFSDRIANLVDEGFDAAIRVGPPGDMSLIARKLCEAHAAVVATPDYLRERGTPVRPEDLANHDCIIDTNFRGRNNWPFTSAGQQISVAVKGRLHYSNAEACLSAAEAGLGVAQLPDFVAAKSIVEGRTVRLLRVYEPPPFWIYALYPPGRHLAAKVRVLVDFMAKRFKKGGGWGIPDT
ncbi:HTH-type transcriptional regulator PgrR [Defluviimonas aquaemixtae]|uniref:HTH-type transcriptional regulator PgrR n=1 Tax=Albidovulum aquaemixtae TaxID=1542388 RepID=A0A2R8B2U9_9RHOB|nr:LysR family transcriptional regulator [Defluviimonas aquaemixtae]SPH16956.1 HTH-type transcriptional regulator PgrR [Defluviimonas aquaemixtae]